VGIHGKGKGKVNLSLCHEGVLGELRYSSTYSLTSALSASHPGRITPQGKSSRYPLDRRLGGPQSRSGRGGEEKNSQPPLGIEHQNPHRPDRSLAAISTELSRLLWVYKKVKFPFSFTEHQAMKACWGSGGIAPRIL
jgi:hypothetical protein